MASSELTDLTAVSTLGGDEVLYVVDDPAGTPLDRKVTVANLLGAGVAIELVQDIVGSMVSGGTETGIAVTYDDTNGRLDFVAEVTQTELDNLPELAADDPTEVGLATVGGVTTITIEPTIARMTDIVAGSGPIYSAPLTATSTAVNNSTTLVNVTGMSVALAASSIYEIEAWVSYNTGTTADIKFGWTTPSGATGLWGTTGPNTAADAPSTTAANWSTTAPLGTSASATSIQARLIGLIRTTNAGTLQLQFAQNTLEVIDTTIRAHSFLKATLVT